MKKRDANSRQFKRPKLLVRAAKSALHNYERDRDLPPLIGYGTDQDIVVDQLAAREIQQEEHRQAHSREYCVQKHVALLTALYAETLAKQVVVQF